MEFANFLIKMYGSKCGVKSDWFSNDPKFNIKIDQYNTQKEEIKEIVRTFREARPSSRRSSLKFDDKSIQ